MYESFLMIDPVTQEAILSTVAFGLVLAFLYKTAETITRVP